jgi:glycosyltransferase involved in cell wall biosynthesis
VSSPQVAVVIPTRDRRDLLLRTLRSVLHQRDVELQVIVVDDGGADGTPEALANLGDARISLIRHSSSKGVSAARNAGLLAAQAPFVAFVDDDDLWAPDKLRAQLDSLERASSARWACVAAVLVDSSVHLLSQHEAPLAGDLSDEMLRRNAVPGGGSGVLVCSDLARAVGGFDESISIVADWDFYLRLSLESPIATVNRPLLAHYEHLDSMYFNPRGMIDELTYLVAKHRRVAPARAFHADFADWFVNFSLMARRLGDRRTAAALFLEGARKHGVPDMVSEVLFRLRGRSARKRAPAFFFPRAELEWLTTYEV